VLGVAFDFLTFKELHRCMFVCQEWLAAVCGMRGLSGCNTVWRTVDPKRLLSSRMLRHISLLDYTCKSVMHDQIQQLARIVAACSFLRELQLEVTWAHSDGGGHPFNWVAGASDIRLPVSLRWVNVRFAQHDALTTPAVNAFLRLLGAHRSVI